MRSTFYLKPECQKCEETDKPLCKSETLNFRSMLKYLPSDVSYKKLLQVLLHEPFWISSSFLLCINLRGSVVRLLFWNHILWFDHEKLLSISLLISTTTTSSCPFSQRGTLWLPLKVKLKMSSASFLNNSSNFPDFGLSISSSLCFIKRHSPAYTPTLLTRSVSWLLRSSPPDKLHSVLHKATITPLHQESDFWAIWPWKLQTLRFTFSSFLSKNSWTCRLTQYLSQNSLWDPNHTVQAENSASTTVEL